MGKTPPYLDPNSHEARYEVDVAVVDTIDQLQTVPDGHDQSARSKRTQKAEDIGWKATETT